MTIINVEHERGQRQNEIASPIPAWNTHECLPREKTGQPKGLKRGGNDAPEFRGEIYSGPVVRVRWSLRRPVVVLVHELSLGQDTSPMKRAFNFAQPAPFTPARNP
jgi:hypothetical protein